MPANGLGQMQVALDRKRKVVAESEGNTSRLHRVTANIAISELGETIIDVAFPVRYVEMPMVSHGCIYTGAAYTIGSIPIASVIILGWIKDNNISDLTDLFVGATVGCVTQGADGDTVTMQVHFEATAFRNPVSNG